MKILIVDDEPLILKGLVKIVEEVAPAGSDICSAFNALEALETMKRFMPDVTVTDINMPEKNGFELIRDARHAGLCDRFIILTGYDEFEYVRQALRSGVVDYLLKPLDKKEIAVLLSRVKEELPAASDSEYSRHAERILAYLQLNYMKDLSLDHLAERMSLHPNYISSLFKKETGDTFVNYLNSLRIREAQKLLKTQPHLTVCAISQQVGFDTKHYFAKVFKKYAGTTPGAYRGIQEEDETIPSINGRD
ncbi:MULTISPECIES: response regulator [unclassified Paenibacillus]|uniref:response regulator transcription factor n=1 Tax=unclassified Paenibacillus TaxID=185978 RepID=UPI00105206A1|nr:MULTISPECIES: response regulator [unclassified Paenibacillus]NIK72086.1 YesN/AraC family two-component response regulator [Paenibacillus sp. BK720]TCM88542.1 AraC family two component transcriptional regulator [Paenibacillus sp. BK033]